MGAIVGTAVGAAGAAIGIWNGKRVARGDESFMKMKQWNAYDFFYALLIIAGLLCLIGGLLAIRYETLSDGYALSLFSLIFLFIGSLNAIIRVRALQS